MILPGMNDVTCYSTQSYAGAQLATWNIFEYMNNKHVCAHCQKTSRSVTCHHFHMVNIPSQAHHHNQRWPQKSLITYEQGTLFHGHPVF